MKVIVLPEATAEFAAMPPQERKAMLNALTKLQGAEGRLGAPHASAVLGSNGIRELRPRAGRSRWRAFYRQVGDEMVIAAFGPEAKADPRGFARSTSQAEARLDARQRTS